MAGGHQGHQCNGPSSAQGVVKELCDGEACWAVQDGFNVGDTSIDDNDDDPAEEATNGDGAADTDWDTVRGVFRFFRHVNTGVEGTDGPDGGHHGQAELPTLWPVGVILHLGEDEVTVVEAALVDFGADGDGDEEEN